MDLTRRTLLASVAAVGVAACSDGPRESAARSSHRRAGDGDPEPDEEQVERRRLERSSFGVTPQLLAAATAAGGVAAWIDQQLATGPPDPDPALPALAGTVEADLAAVATELVAGAQDAGRRAELIRRSVTGLTTRVSLAAAFGSDQLRQRVVDWLGDLLHVSSLQPPASYFLPDYDRLLRTHAFGRFADTLLASARHPAMLVYLDQATSRADGGRRPNENYARELLELHTVGVDGGYDEGDVAAVARVLAGWSLARRPARFQFRPEWQDGSGDDRGALGWTPSPGVTGEAAGAELIEHLAHLPATARRVAHGLARRFVSEDLAPDDPLVREAAEVYRTEDTRVGPVVRHLVTSPRFGPASTLMLRRPVDLVASLLRTGGVTFPADATRTTRALTGLHRVLGQVPYGWPAPDGYPWGSPAWSNAGAVVGRWNAVITLAHADGAGFDVDLDAAGVSDRDDLVVAWCGPDRQLF